MIYIKHIIYNRYIQRTSKEMDRDSEQARHYVRRGQGQSYVVPQLTREGYNNNSAKYNAISSSPFASTNELRFAYYDSLNRKYQDKKQKIRTDNLRFVSRGDEL